MDIMDFCRVHAHSFIHPTQSPITADYPMSSSQTQDVECQTPLF